MTKSMKWVGLVVLVGALGGCVTDNQLGSITGGADDAAPAAPDLGAQPTDDLAFPPVPDLANAPDLAPAPPADMAQTEEQRCKGYLSLRTACTQNGVELCVYYQGLWQNGACYTNLLPANFKANDCASCNSPDNNGNVCKVGVPVQMLNGKIYCPPWGSDGGM